MKRQPKEKFWARVILYEPFIFGGDVWQHYRYELMGEKVDLYDGLFGWLAKVNNKWEVFESVTGGFCGEGTTKGKAIQDAIYNIKRTPDFKKQIEQLGSVDSLRTEETEVVLKRLKNSKLKKQS